MAEEETSCKRGVTNFGGRTLGRGDPGGQESSATRHKLAPQHKHRPTTSQPQKKQGNFHTEKTQAAAESRRTDADRGSYKKGQKPAPSVKSPPKKKNPQTKPPTTQPKQPPPPPQPKQTPPRKLAVTSILRKGDLKPDLSVHYNSSRLSTKGIFNVSNRSGNFSMVKKPTPPPSKKKKKLKFTTGAAGKISLKVHHRERFQ